MKNPAHPGRIVRDDCLEPLGLSVNEGARVLGVTRQALNNVVNSKSGISPEMAVRLAKTFGSTAETWLRMQVAHDLAQAPSDRIKNQPAEDCVMLFPRETCLLRKRSLRPGRGRASRHVNCSQETAPWRQPFL